MSDNKTAITQYDVIEVIRKRWSPRSFTDQGIPRDVLLRILEAGSWAPSSFNEQPWRLIVGVKGQGDTYDRLFSCVNEFNQAWCKLAPVIIFIVGKEEFSHDNSPNRTYAYDCGAAATSLSMQATADGVFVHQMAGIHLSKARKEFNIPFGFAPLTGMVMGYLGESEKLPEQMRDSEKSARSRKTLDEFVYGSVWGLKHNLLG